MKMFATTGERGEPIAAPCTCSKKDPPNWKYVDRRHSSTRWQSSGIGMLVRSSSVSSCCSRWKMTRRTSSTGTLVNRLTTSKLIITSVSAREVWWSRCTKSAEFFTCEGPLPASGERILANSLPNRCEGDPMAATIGLRGIPSL